jgi:hypothetical protein
MLQLARGPQIQQHHAGLGVVEPSLEDRAQPARAAWLIAAVSSVGRRSGTTTEREYCLSCTRNGLVRMKTNTWAAWLACRRSFSAARLAKSVTAS